MAADALAPCVIIMLNMQYKQVLAFYKAGFQLPVPSQHNTLSIYHSLFLWIEQLTKDTL